MSESRDSGDEAGSELAGLTTASLGDDVPKSSGHSRIVDSIADEFEQRRTQRTYVFWAILVHAGISFSAFGIFLLLLGCGSVSLPAGATAAAIGALGVQPLILIGILTTSVYRAPSFGPGESLN